MTDKQKEDDEILEKLYPESFYKEEYIICSAMHYKNGKVYVHQPRNIDSGIVECGRRHHNCYTLLNLAFPEHIEKHEHKIELGFLTSKDRFVSRKEAAEIAFKIGQIKEPNNGLFSEDLY